MSSELVDTTDKAPTIAIVGGGASGTLLASHLLRAGGARVVLIERGDHVGRGVAYGTTFDGHLLNVPAASMTGLPGDPEHFLRYVREQHDPAAAPTAFVPRRVYGAYLEQLLRESEWLAAPGATLVRWRGEVVDLAEGAARPWLMTFADGSRAHADRVVLALGNLPPRDPALASGGWPSDPARYIADPWRPGALAARAPGPVLLVGTGLTMVDVALELQERTPGQRIVALSRGGLFPQAHRSGGAAPGQGVPIPEPTPSLTGLLRFVRSSAVVAEVGGGDWRDAVNALRPVTSELWAALPEPEQRRFLERLARYWDVHRHRLAPAVAEAIDELRESGQLTVARGRIRGVACSADGIDVRLRTRGSGDERELRVAAIVNCTGPAGDVLAGGSRLLAALCAAGTARPHPLALGLDTVADGALLNAQGREHETLFAIGPLRRGELWETTAVPEIRTQAQALARHLGRTRALSAAAG